MPRLLGAHGCAEGHTLPSAVRLLAGPREELAGAGSGQRGPWPFVLLCGVGLSRSCALWLLTPRLQPFSSCQLPARRALKGMSPRGAAAPAPLARSSLH